MGKMPIVERGRRARIGLLILWEIIPSMDPKNISLDMSNLYYANEELFTDVHNYLIDLEYDEARD